MGSKNILNCKEVKRLLRPDWRGHAERMVMAERRQLSGRNSRLGLRMIKTINPELSYEWAHWSNKASPMQHNTMKVLTDSKKDLSGLPEPERYAVAYLRCSSRVKYHAY